MYEYTDIEEGDEVTISYGMIYKWHPLAERQSKLSETYFFECRCWACLERRQPLVAAYRCNRCRGPILVSKTDPVLVCLNCRRKNTLDLVAANKELETAGRLVSLGYHCLIKADDEDNINKLMVGTKLLQDGHTKLSNVLYKNNTQIAIVLDMMASANKKLDRYDEAVACALKYYELTKSEFDEDVYLFNALIKLLDCYELMLNEEIKNSQDDKDDETITIMKKLKREVSDCVVNCKTQLKRLVPSDSIEFHFYHKIFARVDTLCKN